MQPRPELLLVAGVGLIASAIAYAQPKPSAPPTAARVANASQVKNDAAIKSAKTALDGAASARRAAYLERSREAWKATANKATPHKTEDLKAAAVKVGLDVDAFQKDLTAAGAKGSEAVSAVLAKYRDKLDKAAQAGDLVGGEIKHTLASTIKAPPATVTVAIGAAWGVDKHDLSPEPGASSSTGNESPRSQDVSLIAPFLLLAGHIGHAKPSGEYGTSCVSFVPDACSKTVSVGGVVEAPTGMKAVSVVLTGSAIYDVWGGGVGYGNAEANVELQVYEGSKMICAARRSLFQVIVAGIGGGRRNGSEQLSLRCGFSREPTTTTSYTVVLTATAWSINGGSAVTGASLTGKLDKLVVSMGS